ncbi:enzymatic polyprotein [Labeo rohita]|uniref:Enzymatic polyprotein n=1 Tax=Labeo rohita TaxID=84645 RepID=A0ABQ8LVS7_LABRO|nr:enzymatic polyprotein [Labeo rohita]
MRPLQWWLRTKGFSPRGNPFRMIKVMRGCLRVLDMWKKPWFLSQGPVLGAPCRRVTLVTDAFLTGWGAVMSGHSARGLWSSRHLTWHINCLEMLAVFRELKHFLPDLIGRHVLVRTNNTAVVYYINHQGGQTPLAESSSCSWASQYGSRHPVEAGAEARVMNASPRGGEADLESFWPGSGGPLREVGDSRPEGFPLASGRHHPSPSAGVVEVMGVASKGAHLVASGLSTEVVETILQSRAPSTREVSPLHLEGLRGGLKRPTWWLFSGQGPPCSTFPPRCAEAEASSTASGPYVGPRRVLEAFCRPPFEPIEESSNHHLSVKTVLLLALTSLKSVGDLQALSVAPSHLEFAPGMAKAFLYPDRAPQPVILQAFCPPPFQDPDQQKLNYMCPVRALVLVCLKSLVSRQEQQRARLQRSWIMSILRRSVQVHLQDVTD